MAIAYGVEFFCSDEALATSARLGQHRAFAVLVERHRARI